MKKEIEVILYTMKGCPHCHEMKNILSENKINFVDRDIDDHKDEYDLFTKVTANELVPSIMIIEKTDGHLKAYTYVPERDYNELTDALKIIKEHYE